MQRIVVSGASGWLGLAVSRRLTQLGHRVVALCRSERVRGPWERVIGLDLGIPEPIEADLLGQWEGACAVIHCAGHVHRARETAAERELFHRVNLGGTRRLVDACRQAGVPRFVHLSTIAVYDWSQGGIAHENGQLAPLTAYAQSKREAEAVVRDSGLDWCVARLATVFGEGDAANFARLAKALAGRRFLMPSDASACKSVLPVDLAAVAIAELATAGCGAERLLNLALPEAPDLEQIVAAFVEHCGFRRPMRIPLAALRILGCAGDALEHFWQGCPLTSATLNKLTTSTVVDVGRMKQRFPQVSWPSFRAALSTHREYYRQCAWR